ncbi:hypothetical protein EVAR_70876_1 [Eumeta japonica]|uniref:Uncharacterized protein n=1 Tax=Eumeta variegata TaxID=151549 RepID=A0A4C2AHS1_EUMVA|nr:hypothetical protein EVAR_70876_1 [Eumeta japonica]
MFACANAGVHRSTPNKIHLPAHRLLPRSARDGDDGGAPPARRGQGGEEPQGQPEGKALTANLVSMSPCFSFFLSCRRSQPFSIHAK